MLPSFSPFNTIAALSIIVIILVFWMRSSNYSNQMAQMAIPIDHPTKCVECEHQLRKLGNSIYVGQKSKCYTCEKQAVQQACGNPLAAYSEHTIRYHTMPPMPGMGYPKAGYMA